MSQGVQEAKVAQFRERFEAEPRYRLARNACTKANPMDVMRNREVEETVSHFFTHKVDEIKPVTNQKSSGRCWIFACLNCMRLPLVKHFNIEEFELSQNFLFFWDKLERMHFILRAYVDTAKAGEPVDGRLVFHLNVNPSEDGGQWAMLVNLVEKYGVVPRACFPDAWSSTTSRKMCEIVNSKMREYCMILRKMVADNKTDAEIDATIDGYTEEIFRILSVCLGTPPKTITWEFYDKDKKHQKIGPITPRDFYHQHIKPVYNMEDKVCFVNDPRPENPYNKLYTVDYLGNMVGGYPVLYINQDIQVLKDVAAASIKDKEAVWFGNDVRQHCSWKQIGIEDLKAFDYEMLFGTTVMGLSKAERLQFRDSLMTHAMVLTGVSEEEGKTTKWRIENSWGDDGGEKGYLVMTDDWFTEFTYEVVVDKKYVPAEILEILKQTPVALPAWDPMGALAK